VNFKNGQTYPNSNRTYVTNIVELVRKIKDTESQGKACKKFLDTLGHSLCWHQFVCDQESECANEGEVKKELFHWLSKPKPTSFRHKGKKKQTLPCSPPNTSHNRLNAEFPLHCCLTQLHQIADCTSKSTYINVP